MPRHKHPATPHPQISAMTVATPHTACVSEATGDDSETQEDASCLPKMPSFMFGQSMDPEVLAVRPVWDINV